MAFWSIENKGCSECEQFLLFTAKSSPLNTALIVEETRRHFQDEKKPLILVALDANAAFNVVDHRILMRQLYLCGVDDKHWNLIDSLQAGAVSAVKWGGVVSERFQVGQGVRQGGVMSADQYKVYVDPVLHTFERASVGARVGNISCSSPSCADDMLLVTESFHEAQTMVSTAGCFSQQRRYKIQPDKSVVMGCPDNGSTPSNLQLLDKDMPNVKYTTHLGIQRAVSSSLTVDETINNNILKARRTCYSLMPVGLHGRNGLDPTTCIHFIKIYVLPVLTYGLEVLLPKQKHIDKLDMFLKKIVKQTLSLPTQTADPVIYILSGLLPIEGQIHIKTLNFFNNICWLPENTIEKRLARRQVSVKSSKSASWFIEIKKLLWTYDLQDIEELLDSPVPRPLWKKQLFQRISDYWFKKIVGAAKLYPTLKYLNVDGYSPGRSHPLLNLHTDATRDASRVRAKLKIAAGSYVLQTNRAAFNQNDVKLTCLLCDHGDETMSHFLLFCKGLETVRNPILSDLCYELFEVTKIDFSSQTTDTKIKIIIDCSHLVQDNSYKRRKLLLERLSKLEYQCRRLVFALHNLRYQGLSKTKNKKTMRMTVPHVSKVILQNFTRGYFSMNCK